MSWFAPAAALNSWTSWLWNRNSSPFPPSRLVSYSGWNLFLGGRSSDKLESHGSHFLV
jgi:hypothetical protein